MSRDWLYLHNPWCVLTCGSTKVINGESMMPSNRKALSTPVVPYTPHPPLHHASLPFPTLPSPHPWPVHGIVALLRLTCAPPLVFACSHCIQQILEAVLHCHQMGVVHRDLKVSDGEHHAVP